MTYKILAPSYYSRLIHTIDNLDSGNLALDVGCSDGYYDKFLAKKFRKVNAIDINANDLKIAKRNCKEKNVVFILGKGTKLPFKSNSFDEVICIEVIEHVKQDVLLIAEMSRVLKKGGHLILTTPNANFPFSYDPINYFLKLFKTHVPIGMWWFGHLRLYEVNMLKKILLSNKLRPVKTQYLSHLLSGFLEFFYVINLLQLFTKSDPLNQEKKRKFLIKNMVEKDPPVFLSKIVHKIVKADEKLFLNSKTSLGILIKARKI